jgi:serine/threonine protein kinase
VGSSPKHAEVVCDECGKAWPANTTHCPDDGTWLPSDTVLAGRESQVSIGEISFVSEAGRTQQDVPFEDSSITPLVGYTGDKTRPHALLSGMHIGEYLIESKIGEGAMGTVYRAKHKTIGKNVAIKVINENLMEESPEAVKRFATEARAVAMLDHPNIVHVLGFGRLTDGRTYLTMEWLEGSNLARRLDEGPIPYDLALEVIRQIARGLEASHAKNVVHRDLKPENVFLQEYEDEIVVKLVDFGLAKVVGSDSLTQTHKGQIIGTPAYMSPEQCRSKGVDHRSDIYSFGCLCYRLLVGRVPFDHKRLPLLVAAHLHEAPQTPNALGADLPAALDKLLHQMIAKDPAQRPSLAEVRKTVSETAGRSSHPSGAVAVVTGTADPTEIVKPLRTPMQLPTRSASGNRLIVLLLVAIGAIAIAIVLILMTRP